MLYDRILEANLFADTDPGVIQPGGEFPLVGVEDPDLKVALVQKLGSAFLVTYENERRNQMSVVTRGIRKLANSSIKRHDQLALNALLADPDVLTAPATEAFATATGEEKLSDIYTAVSAIENTDLGYTVDTGVLNPATKLKILKDKEIRDALPRENVDRNPVTSGELNGLAGIENWVVSNRMPADKIAFVNRQVVGTINDEVPFYTRTVDEAANERYRVMGARISVPVITDPKAAYILTGV